MAIEGVDYAGSRPDPRGLYAAGKRFAVRYGGPGGDWKHLTAAEARALDAAGLALVANAEGTASGLLGGRAAGVDWARSADAHFRALGMPAARPIYLSVDFDVTSSQWPAVAEALRGAASVIGAARVGVYGGLNAVQWARRDGVARWFWQAFAWSTRTVNGVRRVVWAPGNHLEQYNNGETVAGGTVDLCRALVADYGQWTLTAPAPKPEGHDIVLIKTQDDATIWISDGMQRRAMTNWPAAQALVAAGHEIAVVANLAELEDAAGPVWTLPAPGDDVDPQAVAAAVLTVLTPQAIAAAVPAELADQVADELAARLGS